MENNTLSLKSQVLLFSSLIASAYRQYHASDDSSWGEISVGANADCLSFRCPGPGIPIGRLVRALYPAEGDAPTLSDVFDLEPFLQGRYLEIHSFDGKERAKIVFAGGKRESLTVDADTTTPPGVLVHLEHNPDIRLSLDTLKETMKTLPRPWKPRMFFNGARVLWDEKVFNK